MNKTILDLDQMYQNQKKIVMLTCYDASFTRIAEQAGVDILLVGDSLGMVIQGEANTLAVSMEHMLYHTRAVAKASNHALVLADMPFGSYQSTPEEAFKEASRLIASGAGMVKLEGGSCMAPTISFLVKRGIPVCAHLGLTPQLFHTLGGFRVQGRQDQVAKELCSDALVLQGAGASMLVLECVPETLGQTITDHLHIPTIGIGAGRYTSGQVLVLYDILGISSKKMKFAHDFMSEANNIQEAIIAYVEAVRDGNFPSGQHVFH